MSNHFPGEGHSSSGFRIVLLGRTGSGKSATGNSILGNYHFRSISSSLSETYKCTKGNTVREGKDVVVIDTPGMFDTDLQNYEVIKEINKSIEMTSPGPNVFILVLNVGRFTHEEKKTIEIFLQKFGEEILKYLIVLFTHRDDLEESEMSIEEYIDSTPPYVKKIIKLCNNRYTAFNNDIVDKGRDLQVNRLFGIISNMMWKNRCSCYTSSILQTVNTRNKKRSEQIDRDVHKKVKEDIRKLQDEIYKGFRDGLQTNVYKKQQLEDEFNAENKKQNRLELEIKRLQEQKRRL